MWLKLLGTSVLIAAHALSWVSSPETWLFNVADERLAVAPAAVQQVLEGWTLPGLAVLPHDPAEAVPKVSAARFAVVDLGTSYELASHEARTPHAPASLTKLMTALLVFEGASNLDATVAVSTRAANTEGKGVDLVPGERLSVRQLLAATLVASGNDAAVALAEHVAGSVDKFVERMNARAATLGMNDTHFKNPTGLDADGHISTAADLVILARTFFANAQYVRFLQATSVTLPGSGRRLAVRRFVTTNELTNPTGFTLVGAKTGTTDEAGESFLAVGEAAGHRFIAVVLDSAARFTEVQKLLSWGLTGQNGG